MEFWHIVNRGVDKRDVFLEEKDYVRFVHDMYVFNDAKSVNPNHRFNAIAQTDREQLVDIHAWCLMSNHYHMLVSEKHDGGMSTFMRKLNMGYAKYFNEKYDRSGYLWQGVYRKRQVATESHMLWVPYYIHLNPLDLTVPDWRNGKIIDLPRSMKVLNDYRWSSFLDYQGVVNFPSIIDPTFLSEVLGSSRNQENQIRMMIQDGQKNGLDSAIFE